MHASAACASSPSMRPQCSPSGRGSCPPSTSTSHSLPSRNVSSSSSSPRTSPRCLCPPASASRASLSNTDAAPPTLPLSPSPFPTISPPWLSAAISFLLLLHPVTLPPPAAASTVRLQDVENPRMQEGVRAATQGEFDKAEGIFRAMLEDDGSSASTWSNLGNVHMSQGRAADAVGDYDHAVVLAPEAPVPYLNRAIALEQLGLELEDKGEEGGAQSRWQAAVADCDAAILRDPLEFAAWFNKGNVEMRLQQFDAAEESFRQAADLAPGIPGYRLRQAQVEFQNGKSVMAERLARTVCRKNPSYAEAYASLAAMLYSDGSIGQAEDAFHTATEIEPSFRKMDFVSESTRWPPRLYEVYSQLLTLGEVSPVQEE